MPAERIQPPGISKPLIFSQVVKAGDTVYISGQVALDEQGQLVGRGDITAQATQVFDNLKRCLDSVGADLGDLVKITIHVTEPRYRQALAAMRAKYIPQPPPAATLVVAALAEPDYLIEIEGIAVVDTG